MSFFRKTLLILFLPYILHAADSGYPQVNIDGYKEYRFNAVDILPGSDPAIYKADPYYKNISTESLMYQGLRERFQLDIEAKLNSLLSVKFHVIQEPNLPEVIDVQVLYDRTLLHFGEFNESIKSGSFIDFSKKFKGMRVVADYDNYDFKFISSQEKSTARSITFTGDGIKKEFNLTNTNLLEGTIKVYVNGNPQYEGKDFTLNYFGGKIDFRTIPPAGAIILVQYEFTNPIEDFLPVSGKKNFLGVQANYRELTRIPPQPVYLKATQTITVPTQSVISTANLPAWSRPLNIQALSYPLSTVLPLQIQASMKIGEIEFLSPGLQRGFVRAGQNQDMQVWETSSGLVVQSNLQGQIHMKMGEIHMIYPVRFNFENNAWVNVSVPSDPELRLKDSKILSISKSVKLGESFKISIENKNDWMEMGVGIPGGKFESGKLNGGVWELEVAVPEDLPTGVQEFQLTALDNKGNLLKQFIPVPIYLPEKNQKTLNKYTLPHSLLRIGSEEIVWNNQKLTAQQEYSVNYDQGNVLFNQITLEKKDQLKISYEYLSTQKRNETLQGEDKEGPYYLKNLPVAPQNVQVWVDESLLSPSEYEIQPETGRLVFKTKIYKSSFVRVSYQSVDMIVPATLPPGLNKNNLEVGGAFLQESAKSSQSSQAKIQTDNLAPSLVQNQYVIKLSKTGVINDSSFSLAVNGTPISSNQYILQSGRGWIIPTGSLVLNAASSVNVSYKYMDAVNNSYIYFYKKDMNTWAATSFTMKIQNLYAQSLPMAYKSKTKKMEIALFRKGSTDPVYLQENDAWVLGKVSSIASITSGNRILDIDERLELNTLDEALDVGYITFVTSNNTAAVKLMDLNSLLGEGDYLRILSYKNPNDLPDFGEIRHQVYDIHASYFFNENWKVYADFAQSRLQYTRPVATTRNSFVVLNNGNNVFNLTGTLANPELVENSVVVYLDNNILIENSQYFINYKQGKITILPQALPQATGTLTVEFQYFDSTGSGSTGILSQLSEDSAYATSLEGKVTDIRFKTSNQKIGEKFNPIGTLYYPVGSEINKVNAEYVPLNSPWYAQTQFEEQKKKTSSVGNLTGRSLFQTYEFQQHELRYKADNYNLFSAFFQKQDTLQDNAIETAPTKAISLRNLEYRVQGGLGDTKLNSQVNISHKEVLNQFDDPSSKLHSNIYTDFVQFKNNYLPTDTLQLESEIQRSYVKKEQLLPGFSETRYGRVAVRYQPWNYLTTNGDLSLQTIQEENQTSANTNSLLKQDRVLSKRYFQGLLTRPDFLNDQDWSRELSSRLTLDYKDELVAQKTSKPDSESRFAYFLGLTPQGVVKSSLDWNKNKDIRGDEKDISDLDYYRWVLTDFRYFRSFPMENVKDNFLVMEKMAFEGSQSTRINRLPNLSVSENQSFANLQSFEQKWSLVPNEEWVLGYYHLDKSDTNRILDLTQSSSTSNTVLNETSKPNFRRTYSMSYSPDKFDFPLGIKIEHNLYEISLDLLREETRSQKTDQQAPANNLFSIYLKDSTEQNFKYQNQLSPDWKLYGNLNNKNEYYTNNTSTALSRLTGLDTFNLYSNYILPISGMVLNTSLENRNTLQYSNSLASIPKESLSSQYNQYLKNNDRFQKWGLAYTPFPELTFKEDLGYQNIEQDGTPAPNLSKIEMNSNETGLVYRPLAGLSFDLTYKQKTFQQNISGQETVFKAQYQPFDWPVGKLNFIYERVENSGKGLNAIDQLISNNKNLGALALDLVSRQDLSQRGTLSFELTNQITSQVIETVQLSANWTLISLVDKIKPTNSYQISVLGLGAKILF